MSDRSGQPSWSGQPVHWLVEAFDGSGLARTACRAFSWHGGPLDPNRKEQNRVTCLRCLEYLADREIEKIAAGVG
jgi:hypothetical protein